MNLPNKLTISRLFFVLIFLIFEIHVPPFILKVIPQLVFINQSGQYIALAVFIIAALTDKLDGYYARKLNQVTNFGKFLDPVADKLMIVSALVCLVEKNQISSWVAVIIIAREFIVTGFRLIAADEGIVIAASWSGKVKMATQTVAVILELLNNYPFSLFTGIRIDHIVMGIAVIITIYSGVECIVKNKQVLEKHPGSKSADTI